MTPAAVWKIVRASLDEVLLSRGFKRLMTEASAQAQIIFDRFLVHRLAQN